jgi:hypothetical protein
VFIDLGPLLDGVAAGNRALDAFAEMLLLLGRELKACH